MIKKQIDVNIKNKFKETFLFMALLKGNLPMVKFLLNYISIDKENKSYTIDVTLKNNWGHTAQTLASWKGYDDVAKLILEKEKSAREKNAIITLLSLSCQFKKNYN